MVGLVIGICIVNLLLWCVFFLKFKKLFSTDDVIQQTRKEMNNMILDINRNAERNISLLEDRTTKLKQIINDADRRIQLAQSESVKTIAAAGLQKEVKRATTIQKAADSYKKNSRSTIKPESAYEVKKPVQSSLFDENEKTINTKPEMIVQSDGSAYASVPVVNPKVYFAETPVQEHKTSKSFNESVKELYDAGMSIEQIASKLSCSKTEVQFVIDMS